MKRALILLALVALPLGGCSGKAKAPDDKLAAAGPSKPNPWSSDGAAEPVDPKAKAKPAKKKAAAKAGAEPSNPWAKEPPPGSESVDPAAAKAKPKAK
jgi:hypothetical protein